MLQLKCYKIYHNVFGIAAFDANPLYNGINYAKQAGWNSVSKAIIGGAKFMVKDYIKAGQTRYIKCVGIQTTLLHHTINERRFTNV